MNPMMMGMHPQQPGQQSFPGLNMQPQKNFVPMGLGGPKTAAMGLKGPWHIDPGNPNFPNHRPYMTVPKAPMSTPTAPSQKLKFT